MDERTKTMLNETITIGTALTYTSACAAAAFAAGAASAAYWRTLAALHEPPPLTLRQRAWWRYQRSRVQLRRWWAQLREDMRPVPEHVGATEAGLGLGDALIGATGGPELIPDAGVLCHTHVVALPQRPGARRPLELLAVPAVAVGRARVPVQRAAAAAGRRVWAMGSSAPRKRADVSGVVARWVAGHAPQHACTESGTPTPIVAARRLGEGWHSRARSAVWWGRAA